MFQWARTDRRHEAIRAGADPHVYQLGQNVAVGTISRGKDLLISSRDPELALVSVDEKTPGEQPANTIRVRRLAVDRQLAIR